MTSICPAGLDPRLVPDIPIPKPPLKMTLIAWYSQIATNLGVDVALLSFYYGRFGGARGVIVIVVGDGPGDSSSNPGRE